MGIPSVVFTLLMLQVGGNHKCAFTDSVNSCFLLAAKLYIICDTLEYGLFNLYYFIIICSRSNLKEQGEKWLWNVNFYGNNGGRCTHDFCYKSDNSVNDFIQKKCN